MQEGIEKPQDAIFTKANDFSSEFTHAVGQVLDFQQWVDVHGEYARSLMPGISTPRGIVVIGRSQGLSENQKAKLHRFNLNSTQFEVMSYDDLLARARTLYSNMYLSSEGEKEGLA